MKLGFWKLIKNLVEKDFQIKKIKEKEKVTFQNEEN